MKTRQSIESSDGTTEILRERERERERALRLERDENGSLERQINRETA